MFANFQTLNGGTAGDTFNVTVITAGFPLTLNGNGGGGDTFNVGFDGTSDPGDENLTGSLANVQDAVTINGIGRHPERLRCRGHQRHRVDHDRG